MNRFLLILFGALHVLGLRKFAGETCSKVAFLIDVSESIRTGPDGYLGPGYLPDIKAGLKQFTQPGNLPECTCIVVELVTFASQAVRITPGYQNATEIQDYIDNMDYQINPICDDIDNYANLTDLTPAEITQCQDETYFQQQALSYSNACGRGQCQQRFRDGFCPPYPRCGFSNYEAAFNQAYDLQPNYVILITDGDPTISILDLDGNAGYPKCADDPPLEPDCTNSYCPVSSDCTDVEDRNAGKDAADRLKNPQDLNTKIIAISRQDFISSNGVTDFYSIASCPNDPPTPGPATCTEASKENTTVYIGDDYAASLQQSLLNIPRLAICNTMSPTSVSPTRSPTGSPTFIVSRAPSPSTCCTCSPTQTQGLDTKSPTPTQCVGGSCEEVGCVCLDVANITAATGATLADICYDAACLDACVNNVTLFSPTPLTTQRPTRVPTVRQPTRRRNIFLWLLPFLLGLSGRGGAGLVPQAPNTVVDVYHVIHSGRRLLATACTGTSNAKCPKPIDKWRCANNVCVALPVCTHAAPNCTTSTYCDYSLSVCRPKGTVGDTCVSDEEGFTTGNRTCLDGLFCFSNPARPELSGRCASVNCIECCPCGGLKDGAGTPTTCSPTPALPPVIFGTKSPSTRTPTRKVTFNPWLLLFLFPQLGGAGRYPISQPRPGGGTVVVDIWHIIHARQALFNSSADNKECIGIQANRKWNVGNGQTIGAICDLFVASAAQCCAMCKEAAACVAWEFDARPVAQSYCPANPNPNITFPCRLLSNPSFVSSASTVTPDAITIGFIDKRPTGPQLCTTELDCWNPGASETDEGDGRQWCSDLGGLADRECRTICSADNTCVRAPGQDTCYKQIGAGDGLLPPYGFCVAGFTNCLCAPNLCNPPDGSVFDETLGGWVTPVGRRRRLLQSVWYRPDFCCAQTTETGDLQCCSGGL